MVVTFSQKNRLFFGPEGSTPCFLGCSYNEPSFLRFLDLFVPSETRSGISLTFSWGCGLRVLLPGLRLRYFSLVHPPHVPWATEPKLISDPIPSVKSITISQSLKKFQSPSGSGPLLPSHHFFFFISFIFLPLRIIIAIGITYRGLTMWQCAYHILFTIAIYFIPL